MIESLYIKIWPWSGVRSALANTQDLESTCSGKAFIENSNPCICECKELSPML